MNLNVFMILKNKDNCVSVFEKGGDEDDVTSAAKTILSIACNTVFDKLSENSILDSIRYTHLILRNSLYYRDLNSLSTIDVTFCRKI